MKYLSLFSGIGGFELGITQAYVVATNRSKNRRKQNDSTENEEAGKRLVTEKRQDTGAEEGWVSKYSEYGTDGGEPHCIGFSEIDKYATKIYQSHFPEHKNYGDITKIKTEELPDFDLLVGGFPCQAFSIAGKRQGFEDTRGTLFFEIARILKSKQPRLFLLENVKGLLSHDNGQTFKTIITTLDELGYDMEWQVLNSKNFGVPQNRERVFIVGHLRGTSRPEVFPLTGAVEDSTKQGGAVCKTLLANYPQNSNGTFIKNDIRIRKLTPTECERLQGFPDGWTEGVSDTQRYKCLGNAVTVNVIREIVKRLLNA